ncbi:hypothetical protein GGI35DRAFT_475112 [Trichoderma velutinum]
MSGRLPSNNDPKKGSSSRSANRHSQSQGKVQGSSRQSKGSSSKTSQGYIMDDYLKTPQRHETWDWEKKAKNRNDKNTRL